jgi:nucleotide-binding universal stress UspA family protein
VSARRADAGRTIADHAAACQADVIVVGRDPRSGLTRGLVGAIHERVVQHATCAVLVTPAAAPPARRRARTPPVRSRAAMPGGA